MKKNWGERRNALGVFRSKRIPCVMLNSFPPSNQTYLIFITFEWIIPFLLHYLIPNTT
ncbi:hypothetical protein Hanom_Chr02g00129441 [Helianthus anomalus]